MSSAKNAKKMKWKAGKDKNVEREKCEKNTEVENGKR